MPAANRVVCLLSNPLAVVRGTATTGVEGRLVELPIIDTEAEALNVEGHSEFCHICLVARAR